MQLDKENRKIIVPKILELGNLIIAALIFGFLVSKQSIHLWVVSLGVILYVSCLFISIMLLKKK